MKKVNVGDICRHIGTKRFFRVTGLSDTGLVAEVSDLKTGKALAVYSSDLRHLTDEDKFELL